jgi:hypothetical protein
MNERSLTIMARLHTQIAIQDARVRSDPVPYLHEAHSLVSEVHRFLEDLSWVLNGLDSFDMTQEIAPYMKPTDFNGEALLRVQKAQKMIREFEARR